MLGSIIPRKEIEKEKVNGGTGDGMCGFLILPPRPGSIHSRLAAIGKSYSEAEMDRHWQSEVSPSLLEMRHLLHKSVEDIGMVLKPWENRKPTLEHKNAKER